jgi:hypothetical protein
MSRSRIFHIYGDFTITGEELQNLGQCSGPLSREGSLSYHTCCDMGPRFFQSHPKDLPIWSPLTTHKGIWRTYSNPDPHGFIYFENFTIMVNEQNVKEVLIIKKNRKGLGCSITFIHDGDCSQVMTMNKNANGKGSIKLEKAA